jgi:hypothetical protein
VIVVESGCLYNPHFVLHCHCFIDRRFDNAFYPPQQDPRIRYFPLGLVSGGALAFA